MCFDVSVVVGGDVKAHLCSDWDALLWQNQMSSLWNQNMATKSFVFVVAVIIINVKKIYQALKVLKIFEYLRKIVCEFGTRVVS